MSWNTDRQALGWRLCGVPSAEGAGCVYNDNVSRWRRRRVREQLGLGVPETQAPSRDIDRKLTLLRALAKLTPRQRTVLVLRFYEDLSEQQAAAAMGVAVGTIKSQTRHALLRVQQLSPDLAGVLLAQPPAKSLGETTARSART